MLRQDWGGEGLMKRGFYLAPRVGDSAFGPRGPSVVCSGISGLGLCYYFVWNVSVRCRWLVGCVLGYCGLSSGLQSFVWLPKVSRP